MPAATETSNIVIRDIESIVEMRVVESFEKEIWGCDDRDIVPLTMLAAARESGGILIGAYDGRSLVGFAFGFVGLEDGETVHHSHMLAVNSSHRSHNLGYRLKLAQRERTLKQGIKRMTWTFDPLQAMNAHFNFAKLGVLADKYKVNFYGETTSSPLHQTGTDRLWVSWLLDSPRVKERIDQNSPLDLKSIAKTTLVRCTDTSTPERVATVSDSVGIASIAIPHDIGSIERSDPDLARQWRKETRGAFSEALAAGFVVAEFVRRSLEDGGVGVYVLTRGSLQDLSAPPGTVK
jgi:predicted GNAT superfamily acetyltransferase